MFRWSPISPLGRKACLVCLLAASPAFAEPVRVSDSMEDVSLDQKILLLLDPGGRKSIREVSESQDWKPMPGATVGSGYYDGAIWLRLDLENQTAFRTDVFLNLRWTALDYAQMFRFANGKWTQAQTGDQVPYAQWNVLSYHPAFRIPVEPGTADTIYVRLQSSSKLDFPVLLFDRGTFRAADRLATGLAWLLAGIGVALLGYTAFLFAVSRKPVYPAYACYILLLAGGLFATYGNAFELLWPGAVKWQNRAVLVFFPLASIASLVFTKYYIGFTPGLRWLLCGYAAIAAALGVAVPGLAGFSYSLLMQAYAIVQTAISAGLLVFLAAAAKKGQRQARLLLMLWTPSLLLRIPASLFYLDLLPYGLWTVYGWIFLLPLDFAVLLLHSQTETGPAAPALESYAKSRIGGLNVESLSARLNSLLSDPQVTGDPNLRMADISRMLGIPPYQLSELLNNIMKKSFRNLLNEHRIATARTILDREPAARISDVALRVGFHSKSPFNQAFKKLSGTTPVEYRARIRTENRAETQMARV